MELINKNIKSDCQNKLDFMINEKRALQKRYDDLERKNNELNRLQTFKAKQKE